MENLSVVSLGIDDINSKICSSPLYDAISDYGCETEYVIPFDRGFVYVMWAKGQNIFKIGKSKNPLRRREEVNRNCLTMPFDVELISYLHTPFMSKAEKMLHEQWGQRKMQGEWFRMSCIEATFLSKKEWINLVHASFFKEICDASEYRKEIHEWFELNPGFKPENLGILSVGVIDQIFSHSLSDLYSYSSTYTDQLNQEYRAQDKKFDSRVSGDV